MFCPRCSQEQASAEIRFCSKCGLPLTDIAEAVEGDGYVERSAGADVRSFRRTVFAGLFLMFGSFVFFIVTLILGTPEPSFVVQWNLFATLAVFIAGLAWSGVTLLRGTAKTPKKGAIPNDRLSTSAPAQARALTDAYEAPAAGPTTRELDKVPSVIEPTTRTLRR